MSGPSDEEIARMRAFAEASGLNGIERALAGAVADYRLLKRIEVLERALGINYAEDTLSPALGADSPPAEECGRCGLPGPCPGPGKCGNL